MSVKRILLLILFFFSISFIAPQTSKAVNLQEVLTSEDSIVVRIQEGIEYFFAFRVENKVKVLEKHAEKRLVMAQGYAEEENNEKVQNLLQKYLQIKERQNSLLGKTNGGEVSGAVEERTIEQQKTIEKIKTKIDEGTKQKVIQVQEQVINQVAKRVVDVNGSEKATEFLNKVEHVWAPGTGSGGQGGVVIEGGEMKFAPGTSGGGSSGADIKNVEVKSGGGSDGGTKVEGGNQNPAPGTTSGDNTMKDGGRTVDPGTSSGGEGTTVVGE